MRSSNNPLQCVRAVTIKPLQSYFGTLFNVNLSQQEPVIKRRIWSNVDQRTNKNKVKKNKSSFLSRIAENKRFLSFPAIMKKNSGISPGTFPHCQNNLYNTEKCPQVRSDVHTTIVMVKTPASGNKQTPTLG